MFAYRRTGATWSRHASFRPDETGGTASSGDRSRALRGSAVAPGKFNGRRIQPGGLPESSTLRRTSARVATHPGITERRVFTVWTNPSQYLYLFTARVARNDADARAS